jgi:GxxExxY protein
MHDLSKVILKAAQRVFEVVGPYCSEAVYHSAMFSFLKSKGYEVQNKPIVGQVFEEFDFEMRVQPDFIIDGVIVDLKANQTVTASNEWHVVRCARAVNTDGGILMTMTSKGPVMKIVYTDRNLPTANLSG